MIRPATAILVLSARRFLFARRLASTKPSPATKRCAGVSPTDEAAARRTTLRRVLLTGGITLVTIVGAITGAKLKEDREADQRRRKLLQQHQQERQQDDDAVVATAAIPAPTTSPHELTLDDRIAVLESRRAGLVAMRVPLERKLTALRDRMAGREETGLPRGGRM